MRIAFLARMTLRGSVPRLNINLNLALFDSRPQALLWCRRVQGGGKCLKQSGERETQKDQIKGEPRWIADFFNLKFGLRFGEVKKLGWQHHPHFYGQGEGALGERDQLPSVDHGQELPPHPSHNRRGIEHPGWRGGTPKPWGFHWPPSQGPKGPRHRYEASDGLSQPEFVPRLPEHHSHYEAEENGLPRSLRNQESWSNAFMREYDWKDHSCHHIILLHGHRALIS